MPLRIVDLAFGEGPDSTAIRPARPFVKVICNESVPTPRGVEQAGYARGRFK